MSVRIIAATNRDLLPLIERGAFREDLYYRLNVVPIQLPPLRERREDIEVLTQHFLAQAVEDGLPRRRLSADALAVLEARQWRGNVRELRNLVYRLALMAQGEVIDSAAISEIVGRETASSAASSLETKPGLAGALEQWLASDDPPEGLLHARAIAAFEKPLIEHALKRMRGNQLRAAKLLGINRNTLRKRIVELGIEPERFARSG